MYDSSDKTILKVIGMLEGWSVGSIDISNRTQGGRPRLLTGATEALADVMRSAADASPAVRRGDWLRLASAALAGAVYETDQLRDDDTPEHEGT